VKIVLKDFQSDYVGELLDAFAAMQEYATKFPAAVLLNAPTGSGKTVMATALIEQLLEGSEDAPGDPDLVFVWLTDDPELNKQTQNKMLATSTVLGTENIVTIDASLDVERLTPGNVYLLNTQKLGVGTSFVKQGDDRTFTLWQTIANTIAHDRKRFVLIIDEAHRGARGKDAAEAETIMQKFMKGNGQIPAVPLVVGISATPQRFVQLCFDTNRSLRRVDVDPQRVRESGLLKEWVDLYHPDEAQYGDVTMLIQAVKDWKTYRDRWDRYGASEHEDVKTPVLVVQVEDARSNSDQYSRTDLATVVGTIAKELGDDSSGEWLAHAFQDNTDITVAGYTIRHLAPSQIDGDQDVKVVLFKTSLNTGWDCPRAEVMVSFRSAKDETNIAQLVGRMVRTPLARRIDADDHLNTVALYLPFYDRKNVEKVVERITGDPGTVPPTGVREGKEAVTLNRATDPDRIKCFEALASLPTYTVPRMRPMKPVPRLAKLASLLADTGLETDPVKIYRSALVKVLIDERNRLDDSADFTKLLDESGVLDIRRRRIAYGTTEEAAQVAITAEPQLSETDTLAQNGRQPSLRTAGVAVRAVIADQNVDDLYKEAGRELSEGLHKEYLRARMQTAIRPRTAKLELHALLTTPGVLDKVNAEADRLRKKWITSHKAAINRMEEKYRQALRDIEGAGADPEQTSISIPSTLEWTKATTKYPKHLFVDEQGEFHEDFKSSWERRTVDAETKRDDIVGWLRNPDRKPWSLCVPRKENTNWVPFFPDFIFFRKVGDSVIADIVDPHLLAAEDMPERAVWLANYANKHADQFERIEMVIYESADDPTGKRLDLVDENIRKKVAAVTNRDQLHTLFNEKR
jgi:type III restriction enzyme